MRRVVQFYGQNGCTGLRVAQHEIKMLRKDAVQVTLTVAGTNWDQQHIRHPDFPSDVIPPFDDLHEDSVEGALAGG